MEHRYHLVRFSLTHQDACALPDIFVVREIEADDEREGTGRRY
jgi:hypothetical protein